MKRILLSILITISLTSCRNYENLSKAGNKIAEYCGSNDVTASISNFTSTDKGSIDSYEIKIRNVADINNGSYPSEYLASIAAKTLFDNLNQEERNDRDLIVVSIETPDKKFEYNYSIKELSKVDQYFAITKEFIQKLKDGDLENLANHLNRKTINIDEFNKNIIQTVIVKNQSVFNKIEKIDLHSINFSTVDNNKVTELISFAVFGDSHIKFSTRFIDSNPKKIAGITIN
ncbi:hypothetical protein [Flavobacterium suncheonense]|uniref:Lipoprotein n=1 Tax=Flavobacterium suncheonense GH29-5 = DSM 17707 TaxID=1121899 RepID=A0A0A2MFL5_9FLAO|nr:hypothetical protein [Flavobacterium suncheonense]KGO90208.1 hypothetical protein Q764_03885 [Flavobacterium suncheonense GH29-5 = DSM 17707]